MPPHRYPIANGKRRAGRRCLAVGTDCSVGKMYTALAMEREMHARGLKATFRATGQTGILITGDGVPLDAVVADFMAGSIEWLTPANDPDHWDLIEGQGSLFHASYSGVTLALDPRRPARRAGALPRADAAAHARPAGLPAARPRGLRDLRSMARIVNPEVRVTGVAINTAGLDDARRPRHLTRRIGRPASASARSIRAESAERDRRG